MNYISELKPTNNPISYWGNAIKDTIRSNAIVPSSDFVSDSNAGGTSLELSYRYRYPQQPDLYTGEWNITSSYDVGDIVRVMPDHDYIYTDLQNAATARSPGVTMALSTVDATSAFGVTYTAGQLLLIGNYATSTNTILLLYVKPIPGVYRCCSPIPSTFGVYDTIEKGGFVASITSNLFAGLSYLLPLPIIPTPVLPYIGSDVRFWDVNYFPVWPELPNIAQFSGSDLTGFNGRYWDRIGGLPMKPITLGQCVNGVSNNQTMYIDGFTRPTGSYMNATGSFPNVP